MPAQIPKSWFPGFATRPGSPGLPSVHDVPSRRTWASGETVWFSLCGLPVTPAPALSPPYWQSTLAAQHAMVNKNASVRGGGKTARSNVERPKLMIVKLATDQSVEVSTDISDAYAGYCLRIGSSYVAVGRE